MSILLLTSDTICLICFHLRYNYIAALLCSCQGMVGVLPQSFWKQRLLISYDVEDIFEQFDWRVLSIQLAQLYLDLDDDCSVWHPQKDVTTELIRNSQMVFDDDGLFAIEYSVVDDAIFAEMLEAVTFILYLNYNVHGWFILCHHTESLDNICDCYVHNYVVRAFNCGYKGILEKILEIAPVDIIDLFGDISYEDESIIELLDVCIEKVDINSCWIDLHPLVFERIILNQEAVYMLPRLIEKYRMIPYCSRTILQLVKSNNEIYQAIITYLSTLANGSNNMEDLIDVAVRLCVDDENSLALAAIYSYEHDLSIRAYIRGAIYNAVIGNIALKELLGLPEKNF